MPADRFELAVEPPELVVHPVDVGSELADLVAVRDLDVTEKSPAAIFARRASVRWSGTISDHDSTKPSARAKMTLAAATPMKRFREVVKERRFCATSASACAFVRLARPTIRGASAPASANSALHEPAGGGARTGMVSLEGCVGFVVEAQVDREHLPEKRGLGVLQNGRVAQERGQRLPDGLVDDQEAGARERLRGPAERRSCVRGEALTLDHQILELADIGLQALIGGGMCLQRPEPLDTGARPAESEKTEQADDHE